MRKYVGEVLNEQDIDIVIFTKANQHSFIVLYWSWIFSAYEFAHQCQMPAPVVHVCTSNIELW